MMATNVDSAYFLSQALYPHLKAAGKHFLPSPFSALIKAASICAAWRGATAAGSHGTLAVQQPNLPCYTQPRCSFFVPACTYSRRRVRVRSPQAAAVRRQREQRGRPHQHRHRRHLRHDQGAPPPPPPARTPSLSDPRLPHRDVIEYRRIAVAAFLECRLFSLCLHHLPPSPCASRGLCKPTTNNARARPSNFREPPTPGTPPRTITTTLYCRQRWCS